MLIGISARAQDTIDALEKDLQDIKQTHVDATSQVYANFLSQTQAGMQGPDAALNLYETSGGAVPAGAPVQTTHAHETPTEKAAREAQDAASLTTLASVAQLHCGLLYYAGQFVTTPDQKGLHDEWLGWLKSATTIFVQIKDDGLPQTKELKRKSMKESGISSALGFNNWGDKEQGGWSVKGMPELYRSEILEPLRKVPTPDTLAAWDVYISMKSAAQPDQDRWTQIEQPSLMFDRGCDDYMLTHSMDKLTVLHDILKANPTHPRFDDMLSRMHDLIQDYRKAHPGAATPQAPSETASTAPAADPNVKVTTTQEGDMTIITTQTNAAASTPPAPAPQ